MKENEKTVIRQRIRSLLNNQKEEDRLVKSRVIAERFFDLPEVSAAQTILFYASFAGEVETFEMMRKAQSIGKRIALPCVNKETMEFLPKEVRDLDHDLEQGPYTIRQPKTRTARDIDLQEIGVVVVPGLAFDALNYRLGRGAGYYDRFLARLSPRTSTVGLAFDFQLVSRLPVEPHDIRVGRVLSH